jgi:DNA-nicking Smr family endonuclease
VAKGKRAKGFNTPFAGVRLPAAPAQKPLPSRPAAADPRSDAEIFAAAMAGTAPLDGRHRGERVPPPKREAALLPDDEQLALLELVSLVEGSGPFEVVDDEEALFGRAPGVSDELLSELRAGRFSFHRHLDLHGMSRDEAKAAVIAFITGARRDGERCVLIVTGRGRSSPDGVAVLRQALPRWLGRAPLRAHVLAFTSARQVDGGAGAFYVLLRRPGVRPFGQTP